MGRVCLSVCVVVRGVVVGDGDGVKPKALPPLLYNA